MAIAQIKDTSKGKSNVLHNQEGNVQELKRQMGK